MFEKNTDDDRLDYVSLFFVFAYRLAQIELFRYNFVCNLNKVVRY